MGYFPAVLEGDTHPLCGDNCDVTNFRYESTARSDKLPLRKRKSKRLLPEWTSRHTVAKLTASRIPGETLRRRRRRESRDATETRGISVH
ncbi:Hypothetical predicted protein [Marmota monax]|uniref:Uncharacterized protein n=1 Tax=Marmota monax TaxID=9995 RepID=A0A5E4BSN3_MARMO|nr:hypothetical protein GHT09_017188 [Marmota monax]VTJ72505.1 Hypothetical predicted protein [Marmota monax]